MRTRALAIAAAFLVAVPAFAQDNPPAGFTWHRVTALKARFLVPPGWIADESAEGEVVRLVIAPTQEGAAGPHFLLEARLRLKSANAVERAGAWVREALALGRQVGRVEELKVSTISGIAAVVEVDRTPAEGGPYRRAVSAAGNAATNTIYFMSFTAPSAVWEQLWALAGWTMGSFKLDDAI